MIYLGLDLGSKTLGLSISDKTSTIASSLKVIRYNSEEELFLELSKVVEDYKVDVFVLAAPSLTPINVLDDEPVGIVYILDKVNTVPSGALYV